VCAMAGSLRLKLAISDWRQCAVLVLISIFCRVINTFFCCISCRSRLVSSRKQSILNVNVPFFSVHQTEQKTEARIPTVSVSISISNE